MCKKCDLNFKRNGNNNYWFFKIQEYIFKGDTFIFKVSKSLNFNKARIPMNRKGMECIPGLEDI